MPYQITPHRKSIPTQELLADVQAVAKSLNTKKLSTYKYTALGQFTSATLSRRFGSWTTALKQIGMQPAHNFHLTKTQALNDLQRVAKLLNTQSPKISDYRQHGHHTTDAIRKHFGPWHKALLAANLKPKQYRSLTDEELFNNLKSLWNKIGRQPTNRDLRPPNSICTIGPYLTRFQTWTNALQAFQHHLNPKNTPAPKIQKPKPLSLSTHINWRIRYQVLKRDHFKCQACGRSPATHPNLTLHIDHKIPKSQGGPPTLENLQTLCPQCNIGKSNTTPIPTSSH